MRQFLTYGSVRGVPGNRHPYRDLLPSRTNTSILMPDTKSIMDVFDFPYLESRRWRWGIRTG